MIIKKIFRISLILLLIINNNSLAKPFNDIDFSTAIPAYIKYISSTKPAQEAFNEVPLARYFLAQEVPQARQRQLQFLTHFALNEAFGNFEISLGVTFCGTTRSVLKVALYQMLDLTTNSCDYDTICGLLNDSQYQEVGPVSQQELDELRQRVIDFSRS